VLGPRPEDLSEDPGIRAAVLEGARRKFESFEGMVEEILSAKEKAERIRQSVQTQPHN